jgi:hypothetical protein
MRETQTRTITVANGDSFSESWVPNGSAMAITARVVTGDPVDLVLQGGQERTSTDTGDWVDVDYLLGSLTAGTPGAFASAGSDGHVFAIWPFYRIKATGTDDGEAVVCIVEF